MKRKKLEFRWKERKRNSIGLPWSFTVYMLTADKLLVDSGVFSKTSEEILLYRIIDLTVKRSFVQRIFGLGTVHCCTRDKTTPELDLKNIRNPIEVKELISKLIEESRMRKGYTVRELMSNGYEDCDNEYFD